jgi:hypothetical protein
MIVPTTADAQSLPTSQPPQTSAAPAASQPPAQQEEVEIIAKRLCKRAEPVIGTRLATKRRCNTPAELAAYQRQAREFIDNYRRRPCIAGTEAGEGQAMSC